MGIQENRFVDFFYNKFKGRISIGVGYGQDMLEIFPFLFEDNDGHALGIAAMAPLSNDEINSVHIFHISAFRSNRGSGSAMLEALCFKADQLGVMLSLSPIPSPNGKAHQISSRQLVSWYRKFGFIGDALLCRSPGDL